MLELTLAIVAHAVLGVALAGGVWSLGLGILSPERSLFAYPFGLLVAIAAATLVLVSVWLLPLAVVLVVPPIARGLARLPRAGLWGVLPAVALGTALGLVNHGPTESVDSSAYGDMLFYAAKGVSAADSIFPFRDLLVEGERNVYVESGWSLLGGALDPLGLDPILLQAASAPGFFLAALGIGFALLRGRAVAERDAALVALLAAGAIAYPTWLTESPPVALAAPAAFALYGLWRDQLVLPLLLAVGTACALVFFLTKVLGLVPLTILGAIAIVRDHRRAAPALLGAAAAGALAAIALFAADSVWLADVLEAKFLPVDAARGLRRQLDVRDTQAAATSVLMVGELLLAYALARRRAWALLAVLGAAMAGGWLLGGHGFDIALGVAVLLAACALLDRRLDVTWPLLGGAAAFLAAAAWFRDIAGVGSTLLPLALIFLGVVLSIAPRARGALLVGAASAAVGLVTFPADRTTTLTTEDREAWALMQRVVPAHGLVFTSETGPRITGDEGWNYYPGIWSRQLYVAGWSNSPLLVDDTARAERLAANRGVLVGRLDPRRLELDRRYGSYYAVVETDGRVPPSFRRVGGNRELTVYAIP